jgi:hypothetical protein
VIYNFPLQYFVDDVFIYCNKKFWEELICLRHLFEVLEPNLMELNLSELNFNFVQFNLTQFDGIHCSKQGCHGYHATQTVQTHSLTRLTQF